MSLALHTYLGLVALLWLGALLSAARRRRKNRYKAGLDEAPLAEAPPRLVVVVPARDEVADIGPCVDALFAGAPDDLRVVVLDDGSADGTDRVLAEAAARHPGLTVVDGGGGPLPEGWYGKPWACQRAGRVALDLQPPPDWLLFVDADVRVSPGAPSAALRYAVRNDLALLSGFGRLDLVGFWEKVVQPAVVGMIIAGNDVSRTNEAERRKGPPLANGQFMLARRDAYEAVGGHEAVAHNVVDDVGMAIAITDAGYRYHLVFMRELFSVRMYDSWSALWDGWTKNLFAGLGRSWGTVVALVLFNLLAVVVPYFLVVAGLALGATWGWTALAAVVFIQALRAYMDDTFDQPLLWGQLTHLLGQAVLVALILGSAVRSSRGTATWKGRQVG